MTLVQLPRLRASSALCLLACGCGAVVLAVCSAEPSQPRSPIPGSAAAPVLPTPLATSVEGSDGVWATVAMGHLDDPDNTFWQLFHRAAGSSSWSDQVEPTATATNGGLVLTSTVSSLLVGILPYDLLTFTPLIATSNDGRSWATGLLADGLVRSPDSLATSSKGSALALVKAAGGNEVLAADNNLSSWTTLDTQTALSASTAGQRCGVSALTAVAYTGDEPLVGASCSRSGVAGIFAGGPGAWHLVGPTIGDSLGQGRVEVLSLEDTPGGAASALLGVSGGAGASLVAAWSDDGGQHWTTSAALALGGGQQLVSYGLAGPSEIFVLTERGSGAPQLSLAHVAGSGWEHIPPPPAGTATIAAGMAGTLDALVTDDTVLSVWTLAPKATRWVKGQVIDVPIQFGSSS